MHVGKDDSRSFLVPENMQEALNVKTESKKDTFSERTPGTSLRVDEGSLNQKRRATVTDRPRITITDPGGEQAHHTVEEKRLKEEQDLSARPIDEAKRETRENETQERAKETDFADATTFESEGTYPERARKNTLFLICYLICTHWMFTFFITLLILGNTIILAMDRYPIKEDEFKALGKIAPSISCT